MDPKELRNKIQKTFIDEDRKAILLPLINYLKSKLEKNEAVILNYICTHNSRRSQFAQFWSDYFSSHFQLEIDSNSGGTEVTACHPNTIASLERFGFEVESKETDTSNPHYIIKLNPKKSIELYSKLHTDSVLGKGAFAALMCCSDAGENCPFVPGTEITVPLYYTDPKHADGSPNEEQAYDECSIQIASEIYYVFSKLRKN